MSKEDGRLCENCRFFGHNPNIEVNVEDKDGSISLVGNLLEDKDQEGNPLGGICHRYPPVPAEPARITTTWWWCGEWGEKY